jgi:hypothetical protein
LYREGQLDDRKITVDVPGSRVSVTGLDAPSNQALQVSNDHSISRTACGQRPFIRLRWSELLCVERAGIRHVPVLDDARLHVPLTLLAVWQEMISRLDRVISTRKSSEKREMKVSEARPIIEDMVSERIINEEVVRHHPDCCHSQWQAFDPCPSNEALLSMRYKGLACDVGATRGSSGSRAGRHSLH